MNDGEIMSALCGCGMVKAFRGDVGKTFCRRYWGLGRVVGGLGQDAEEC